MSRWHPSQSLSFAYSFNTRLIVPQTIVVTTPQSLTFTGARRVADNWLLHGHSDLLRDHAGHHYHRHRPHYADPRTVQERDHASLCRRRRSVGPSDATRHRRADSAGITAVIAFDNGSTAFQNVGVGAAGRLAAFFPQRPCDRAVAQCPGKRKHCSGHREFRGGGAAAQRGDRADHQFPGGVLRQRPPRSCRCSSGQWPLDLDR